MAYGEQSYKNLANGSVRAFHHLIDAIVQFGKISESDAEKVAMFYKKNKFVKFDAIHGTSHIKHGQFFDADIIARALIAAS